MSSSAWQRAASQQCRARAPWPFAVQCLAVPGGQHLPGGPPRRAAVPSNGQACLTGCGCHEGLHAARRHRAGYLLWLRHDDPGGGACGATRFCPRNRTALCRCRHSPMAGIYPQRCDPLGQWPRLRRTCRRSDRRCWSGRCCGGKMTMSQLPARRDTTGSHSLLSEAHDAPADSPNRIAWRPKHRNTPLAMADRPFTLGTNLVGPAMPRGVPRGVAT